MVVVVWVDRLVLTTLVRGYFGYLRPRCRNTLADKKLESQALDGVGGLSFCAGNSAVHSF